MRKIEKLKIKILAAASVLMIFAANAEVSAQSMDLYELQSLFIYHFTKHVKWTNESSEFTVGIYGNSGTSFNEMKENLNKRYVWGSRINVIAINTPADISKCNIAFMTKSNKKKILDMVNSADFSNTLLVTEEDMISDGAAISFIFDQSKLKFKINKERLEQSGLKVTGTLLSMGIAV